MRSIDDSNKLSSGKVTLKIEVLEPRQMLSAVVGRQLFYNQSGAVTPLRFDGNDPAINANDDAAIATDKVAYRPAVAPQVRQLTNNNTVDQNPQVYGNTVVWQGQGGTDAGTDYEIFSNTGATTTQLTANSADDTIPKISSGGVVWQRGSGNGAEIIFNNGSEVPVTTNSISDANPVIGGSRVSWEQGSGTALEIASWDGLTTSNLSNNSVADVQPSADGAWVAWTSGSTPAKSILVSDGTNTNPVGTSTLAMDHPDVSEHPPGGGPALLPNVVWEGFAGLTTNDREIYMFDGLNVNRLTTNAFPDFNPRISGDKVVWWGGVFNNFQIYMWDGSLHQLSTGTRSQFPQIDGDNVVWQGFDGVRNQIFFWNGHEVIQVTNNNYDNTNPQISGNHIVWQGQLGPDGTGLEIFDATIGGGPTTFANVSSYTRGINGVMVDLSGAHGAITANDFTFKVGNNNSPSLWSAAPAPNAVSVRAGAGSGGADRIEITWPTGAILGTWLQVIVDGNDALGGSNTNTGLAASDVFFFGNAPADSGAGDSTDYRTNVIDEQTARNDPHSNANPATITNRQDFNRDGLVNTVDQLATRNFTTNPITSLKILAVAAGGPFAPAAPSSGDLGIASALSQVQAANTAIDEGSAPRWCVAPLESPDRTLRAVDRYFGNLAANRARRGADGKVPTIAAKIPRTCLHCCDVQLAAGLVSSP
jgi:hypothetical protein